jgi:hypothetical protein
MRRRGTAVNSAFPLCAKAQVKRPLGWRPSCQVLDGGVCLVNERAAGPQPAGEGSRAARAVRDQRRRPGRRLTALVRARPS